MTMVVSATGETALLFEVMRRSKLVDGLSAVMVMRLARHAGYAFRLRDDGVHLVSMLHHEFDDTFPRPEWLVKALETHAVEISRLVSDTMVEVCYLKRVPTPQISADLYPGNLPPLPVPPTIG